MIITMELEPWVIDYEFNTKTLYFQILTTPMNRLKIYDIFLQNARVLASYARVIAGETC